jgi:mersacidin/lichenicidin family type 2 lantibiotic
MSNEDIIRAWKDEDYWNSLHEEQRSQLPENPAGTVEEIIELTPEEQEELRGGFGIFGGGACGQNTILPNGICIDPKMTKSPISCR